MTNWLSQSTLCNSFNSFCSFVARLHRRHFIISFSLPFYKKQREDDESKNYRIYLPQWFTKERIKLPLGEFKLVNMKIAIWMPEKIVGVSALLPTLSKNGLKLENFQYILADNNICNAYQLVTLPWKIHIDLAHRSMSRVIFMLSEGKDKLNVNYTKSTWILMLYLQLLFKYFITKILLLLFRSWSPDSTANHSSM